MKASEMVETVKGLADTVKGVADEVKKQGDLLQKMQEPGYVNKGVPHVRVGEDPLSSRPFLFSRVLGVVSGDEECQANAKFEIEECNRLKKALRDMNKGAGYNAKTMVVPLSWDLLPDCVRESAEFEPLKKAMRAGAIEALNADPERVAREAGVPVRKAAMSYQEYSTGGSVIAPPEFGDLITPLRNNVALMNIGAKTIPLPPQGTIMYPRMTGDVTAYALGENPASGITESNPTTDDLTLTAKAIAALVTVSNQFLRFSRGVGETLVRDSLTAQLGLQFDKQALEGVGSSTTIQGVINATNKTSVTAAKTGTNGNTWSPKDMGRMIAAAAKKNSKITHWIMAPGTFYGITEYRGDAVVVGDQAGPYTFDMMRLLGAAQEERLKGLPVVKSTQVSLTRTKGSASDLTYILGVDKDKVIIAMHGALEIAMNEYGTVFDKNQSKIRAIMYGDVGLTHHAGVTFMDQLVQLDA